MNCHDQSSPPGVHGPSGLRLWWEIPTWFMGDVDIHRGSLAEKFAHIAGWEEGA